MEPFKYLNNVTNPKVKLHSEKQLEGDHFECIFHLLMLTVEEPGLYQNSLCVKENGLQVVIQWWLVGVKMYRRLIPFLSFVFINQFIRNEQHFWLSHFIKLGCSYIITSALSVIHVKSFFSRESLIHLFSLNNIMGGLTASRKHASPNLPTHTSTLKSFHSQTVSFWEQFFFLSPTCLFSIWAMRLCHFWKTSSCQLSIF